MRFYKDLTILYFISSVGGALTILAVFGLIVANIYTALIFSLLWVFVCALFFSIKAGKRLKALDAIMTQQCNCRRYIAETEKLFKRATKRNTDILLINLSAGYANLGEPKKALSYLQAVNFEFKNSAKSNNIKAVYYNDLAAVYIQLGDTENAEKALSALKQIINTSKLYPGSTYDLNDMYQAKKYILDIEKGDYEGAEKTFLYLLEKEKTNLARVSDSYMLAKIYMHNGEPQKAEQYISFVLKNGGDTHYVKDIEKLK